MSGFVCFIDLKAAIAHRHDVDSLALTNLCWPGTVGIDGEGAGACLVFCTVIVKKNLKNLWR